MATHRARTLGAVCLFVALATIVWVHRVHVDRPAGYGVLLNSDVFMYFYPTAVFVHRELRQGHFPLWNPYQYAGQPFVGLHIPAALYPPFLVLAGLLTPPHALAAYAVVHFAVAGLFTWLFAARLGLGVHARLVAALSYMLSGPLLLGIYMVPYLSTHAWFPAILWALQGLLTEARLKWAVALAVVTSLAFLAGHAQGFLYEMQFALLFGLLGLCCTTPTGLRLRVLGLAALAGALALGFVGPQLLPALELAQRGTRDLAGIPVKTASLGAVFPDSLRWGLLGYFETHRFALAQGPVRWLVTLPAATVPLAACGLLARRQKVHWLFFLVGAALVALFMLGDRGPVYPIYHGLPLGNLFRNPSRLAFLYAFLAAMVLSIGLEGVTEFLRVRVRWPVVASAVATLVTATIGVEVYARTKLGFAHPALGVPFQGAPAELVDYMRARPDDPRLFIEQVGRFPNPVMFFKTGMMNGISVVPDYEPNMPAAYRSYFGFGGDIWHGRLSVRPGQGRLPIEVLGKLLDLMSVRYYALLRPAPGSEHALRSFAPGRRDAAGPVGIFERPSALPRAFVVRKAVVETDAEATWRHVTQESFEPRREAVVNPHGRARNVPLLDGAPTDGAGPEGDTASIVTYAAQEVQVAAQCRARCLLVLTDLYYPGWHAYVDGQESEIHQVNAIFRGVYLEPGTHRIVYRYEPGSFRIGLSMMALAVATASALLYRGRRHAGCSAGAPPPARTP